MSYKKRSHSNLDSNLPWGYGKSKAGGSSKVWGYLVNSICFSQLLIPSLLFSCCLCFALLFSWPWLYLKSLFSMCWWWVWWWKGKQWLSDGNEDNKQKKNLRGPPKTLLSPLPTLPVQDLGLSPKDGSVQLSVCYVGNFCISCFLFSPLILRSLILKECLGTHASLLSCQQ